MTQIGYEHVTTDERYLGNGQTSCLAASIARSSGCPVACSGDMHSKYLAGKPLVTRLFPKHEDGWTDNIKTDLTGRALIVWNRVCEQDDLEGCVETGSVSAW